MKRTWLLIALAVGGIAAAFLLPKARRGAAPVPTTATTAPTTAVSNAAGSITLRVRPARHAFLAGGDDVDVVYELEAAQAPGTRRAPVDFALVLDRSGSMTGEPLAAAKKAAKELVGRLTEADRLAIVAFGSDAAVLMTPLHVSGGARADATRLIDAIEADGGTNMSDALEAAARALEAGGAREGAVRRIVLLSDGQATEGITGAGLVDLPRQLGARGIRTSALGLGLDFDEDTMLALADAGGGQYRYLRDGDDIAAAFTRELAQASATAASGVRLALEAADGIELREVVGVDEVTPRKFTLGISDIAAGEVRRVVVRVRASAKESGRRELLRARLEYEDVLAGRAARGAEAVAVAEATADRAKVAQSYDQDAAKASLRARWGGAVLGATRRYEKDDVEGASAGLDGMLDSIRETAQALGDSAFAAEFERSNAETQATMRAAPSGEAKVRAKKNLKEFARDNRGY